MTNKEAIEYFQRELNDICGKCKFVDNMDAHTICDYCKEKKPYKIAAEAIKKQIPKKPTYENIGSVSGALKRTCNQCGDVAMIRPEAINYEKYCRYCGQRFIDWSEEE